MVLEEIIARKREDVEEKKRECPLERLLPLLKNSSGARDFSRAIEDPGKVNIIAEMKKASPSEGVIREPYSVKEIARIYQEGGAVALSVLTEKNFFQGELEHIKEAKESSALPLLRKDFVIDEYQIYESRAGGADAILLIASILDRKTLERFLKIAESTGLDCLVEVHSREELEEVLETNARIIGVNNRNLDTLQVDLRTSLHLISQIPPQKIAVAESGISSFQDVRLLKEAGFRAFLVGTALLKTGNIGEKIRELTGNG